MDTAKRVFQLHWVDLETGEIVDLKLTRARFLEHFANRVPCLIAMEACGGLQHWARRLQEFGHEVRLLAGQVGDEEVRVLAGAPLRFFLQGVPAPPMFLGVLEEAVDGGALSAESAVVFQHPLHQSRVWSGKPSRRPSARASSTSSSQPL